MDGRVTPNQVIRHATKREDHDWHDRDNAPRDTWGSPQTTTRNERPPPPPKVGIGRGQPCLKKDATAAVDLPTTREQARQGVGRTGRKEARGTPTNPERKRPHLCRGDGWEIPHVTEEYRKHRGAPATQNARPPPRRAETNPIRRCQPPERERERPEATRHPSRPEERDAASRTLNKAPSQEEGTRLKRRAAEQQKDTHTQNHEQQSPRSRNHKAFKLIY